MTAQENIIDRIKASIPALTISYKKIADYIIKNPIQAAFSTVSDIAQSVKTSTATIVRFALTLGFSGYVELQKNLQEYLKANSSPLTKLEINIGSLKNRNTTISDIARQQIENVNTTYSNLSDELIFQAAKKISTARHIYVFGQRSCYGVSHYLAYNINRILGNCEFIYNGIDIIEWLHNITEKDVVISISLPRYLKHVVRFSELAHKRGAFVIALSDGYTSPFITIADIVFFVDGKSKDFHNAMTSSIFIADILIGVLASQNSKRTKANLKDTENILSLLDQTVY